MASPRIGAEEEERRDPVHLISINQPFFSVFNEVCKYSMHMHEERKEASWKLDSARSIKKKNGFSGDRVLLGAKERRIRNSFFWFTHGFIDIDIQSFHQMS